MSLDAGSFPALLGEGLKASGCLVELVRQDLCGPWSCLLALVKLHMILWPHLEAFLGRYVFGGTCCA